MIRFRWLSGVAMLAAMGACSDDGAVTSAGVSEGSTGAATTGSSSTGSTSDSPTTDVPTTGGTGDGTTGTTGTTGTPSTSGVMTGGTTMTPGVCGDGILDDGEVCDGADLGGQTCMSLGLGDGTLGCLDTCTHDTSGCVACGDRKVDPGETCDDGNVMGGDGCDEACQIEACDPDGAYMIEGAPVGYTCCNGLVTVNINAFIFSADGASIASSPSNPVNMTGAATMCPDGGFMNSGMIAGGCTEVYSVEGDFVDPNTWMGTYSLEFIGDQCSCFNGMFGTPCIGQDFPVTATR